MTTKINTALFTWNKESKWLVAEASDLELPPGQVPFELTLVSHRTGAQVRFEASRIVRDAAEDDILAFVYKSPGLPVEVHILND